MPAYIREQYLNLHPYQRQKFHELLSWSNAGSNNGRISDIAYEKAISWAQQIAEPEPEPELPEIPTPGEE